MPRPCKNTKRTATRNTPQPTNEPSTTFTTPSIVITDDVPSVTDKTKKDLNELDDNINTSNLPNKYIKLSNEKKTMKCNQEVDKVLVHKTSIEINDDDINDDDTIDTNADIYTAIQPESSSELSKNAVPFKDDTVPSTKDQDSAALITSLTSNNFTPIFAALFQAMTSSIITTTTGSLAANSTTTPTVTNTNMNNTTSNNTQLATLFINESKVLFLRIRKLTPELILSLGRECARHLGITELKAGEIKKKECGWFSTWRVRLYDQCTEMAFNFLNHYSVTMSNLPNSSHLRNFVSTDDIFNIFEPQLKQIKKDRLLEDQSSLIMLKNYLVEVILIMVCYFVRKNVDLTIYNNATKIRRTEWRSAILGDLHALDHMTVDLHVISESGITIAQDINIRGHMNWSLS
ncbi:unnamed protein product [Rhizophagus irregularis]|nr:unnamed protein product [Rhizophagus irregularis]